MEQITLGKSGVKVSALFQGTDVFGSKLDKQTAFGLMDHYTGQGGTTIDTGNFYAAWLDGFVGGESENTIGEWVKSRGNRAKLTLCTKLGFEYPSSPGGLTASEIKSECEKSLKRLQTDHLDILYSHKDDFNTPQEETMAAYHELVKAGKVRAIGASNLYSWRISSANTIAKLNGLTPYSIIQQRYTYVRPRHGADFGPQLVINDDLKAYAASEGIQLVAFSMLLSGAYTRSERPLPPQYASPDSDERVAALKKVAAEVNRTPNQVVIAWLRQSSPSVIPIIAGSKKEQYDENINALSLKLTEEQMNTLNNAGNSVEGGWLQS